MKLGYLLSDSIIGTTNRHSKDPVHISEGECQRISVFKGLIVIVFLVIFIQTFRLMIVQGSYYKGLADGNKTREIIYPAPRGAIYDRKGDIIVRNKPSFIYPVKCADTTCYKKITHEEAIKMETIGKVSPLDIGVSREFIDNFAFSHIIGNVGYVSKEEIGSLYCNSILNYEDELGRSGVEKSLDCDLKGTFGKELVETDVTGNKVRTISKIGPFAGKSVTLSIDKELQTKAQILLNGKKGAIIIHNPTTGEILSLVSSPSYDINKIAEGLSEKEYNDLLKNPDKPLLNRAISGLYPPGSTFKPILAAGILEEKLMDENTQVEDEGVLVIGPYSFPNWYFLQYGKKEGPVNVVKALKRSNDIFFYRVGEKLGVDRIDKWADKFYLGRTLGINLSGEEAGTVPNVIWKEKVKGEQWFLGDTYHLAIGQGDLLVTPLQIAYSLGSFANSGIICKPSLLKNNNCTKLTEKLYSDKTLQIIKEGLVEACATGGTGYPFFDYKVKDRNISVACKTGTAEYGDPDNKTHAWFFAFAPAVNPQIAVTVLVEGAGEGSVVSAPIAKEIMDLWFSR